MALSITVAGTDRTSSMRFETLEVTNTVAANADVARMQFTIPSTAGWRPMAGNEIIVANGTGFEFGGILMTVTEKGMSGSQNRYMCDCRDYLHLFNKKVIAAESSELANSTTPTAGAIVSAIVALSTDGFSSTGVQVATPVVATQKYDYIAPGDIIRTLATSVNYIWWIDYGRVVNFVDSLSFLAPTTAINLDSAASSEMTNYGAMDISESFQQLKTRVFVKDWKQKSSNSYNPSFVGDGASKFFDLGYEASSIADVSASINGTALTVLTDGIDGSAGDTVGTSSSIFICFDNLGARMNNYAPTSTETLSITMNYMTPGIIEIEDSTAQSTAAAREGGDGIHEFAISDPGKTASDGSASLAFTYGNSILKRDDLARITGKFRSYTQGWRAGQSLTLNSTKRMNGDINGRTVFVQQVTKKLVNHLGATAIPTLAYDIEFSDGTLAQ